MAVQDIILLPTLVQDDWFCVFYEVKIGVTESSSFLKPWHYRRRHNRIDEIKQLTCCEKFPEHSFVIVKYKID
jgi:hypothetical protein